jgi:hypothetical protein
MLDELYIDGVRFKAARRAASLAGISPDYLTRWCREGWVQARQLAGGVWFVSIPSLEEYLAEKSARKEEWRAHLAQLRRDEQQEHAHPAATTRTKSISIAAATVLIICIAFPHALFASQIPSYDLIKFLKRARTVHERGIRISSSLSLKIPTEGDANT